MLGRSAGWQVLQPPAYLQHGTEFRRAADSLTEAAKAENLDGAALAQVQMTTACIDCHKYVRGVRMARLENAPGLGR